MKKILFIIGLAIFNGKSFAQNITSFLSEQTQKEILNTVMNLKDKLYNPAITPDTKVLRVLDGYVICSNKWSASFDIDYINN